MDFRVGFGYDSHRLAEGLPLRLCGVTIPSNRGCVAHSDGDAAIHAICDALLGAAALGDIGTHFPDNDPKYKGIDSTLLLQKTVELLHNEGWKVNNADAATLVTASNCVFSACKANGGAAIYIGKNNSLSFFCKNNRKIYSSIAFSNATFAAADSDDMFYVWQELFFWRTRQLLCLYFYLNIYLFPNIIVYGSLRSLYR